ncbi:MAG: hypothetical protein EZS28_052284, partial [Streblomastix strix]
GDGEKGFNGNILKTFCQENNITSFFTDSKFTNHNRVVDSVIRTIRNGFGNESEKFANNDLIQQMNKPIPIMILKGFTQDNSKVNCVKSKNNKRNKGLCHSL